MAKQRLSAHRLRLAVALLAGLTLGVGCTSATELPGSAATTTNVPTTATHLTPGPHSPANHGNRLGQPRPSATTTAAITPSPMPTSQVTALPEVELARADLAQRLGVRTIEIPLENKGFADGEFVLKQKCCS